MNNDNKDNFRYWNRTCRPPTSVLKPITAGRLTGKSDINPQWRYQAMTEVFGIVGFGWKYTIDRQWTENGANEEVMAFVNLSLYIKVDGAWSEAIPGTGGATLISKERSGYHSSDEAYKMATTDALSVAMKMLGVAAEIYLGNFDGSKYKTSASPTEETVDPLSDKAISYYATELNVSENVARELIKANPKFSSGMLKSVYKKIISEIKAGKK